MYLLFRMEKWARTLKLVQKGHLARKCFEPVWFLFLFFTGTSILPGESQFCGRWKPWCFFFSGESLDKREKEICNFCSMWKKRGTFRLLLVNLANGGNWAKYKLRKVRANLFRESALNFIGIMLCRSNSSCTVLWGFVWIVRGGARAVEKASALDETNARKRRKIPRMPAALFNTHPPGLLLHPTVRHHGTTQIKHPTHSLIHSLTSSHLRISS